MKKVERYIYIVIIIILVGVIASGATYIIMKNNNKAEIKENDNKTNNNEENNNQNEEPTVKEDGVKLLKTYNLNDKIVEEFEITLNGKTNSMKIEFDYDEDNEESNNHTLSYLGGKLNNNLVLSYIEDDTTKNNLFNTAKVKEKFNENNFKIIKGKDNKNYLLLITNTAYVTMYESKLLIFNDNLEQIKGNFDGFFGDCSKSDSMIIVSTQAGYKFDTNPYYKNNFNIDIIDINLSDYQLSGVNVKIENNKIYYLAPALNENYSEGNVGILEEREYSINNDKLEYEVINSYKIIDVVAGQIC